MMKNKTAKDVDSYLAALPKDQRLALAKLRKAIRSAAPQAEECISYGIPCYKYFGWLVFFGAFKSHLSFFVKHSGVRNFGKELAAFDIKGTTVHFTPKHPLPAALVKKIVKANAAENEMRRLDKAGVTISSAKRNR